jgi:Right handed beta helix region
MTLVRTSSGLRARLGWAGRVAPTRRVRLTLDGFEERINPVKTYTVTTTTFSADLTHLAWDASGNAYNTDDSPLSFGQAINAVGLFSLQTGTWFSPGPNVINFNIPGAGVKRLETNGSANFGVGQANTTIDGFTQPGSKPNTAPIGSPNNAKVLIEFDLRASLLSSFNTIRGMSLRGIDLAGDTFLSPNSDTTGNRIEGNFLGLKADGKTPFGDRQEGVYIGYTNGIGGPYFATNTVVGGGLPAQANVIGGHTGVDPTFGAVANGILIDGSHDNLIVGNYIGTTITGANDAGNSKSGIRVAGIADSNRIEKNVIAFNDEYAIRMDGGQTTTIVGNSLFSNGKDGIYRQTGANGDVVAPGLTSLTATSVTGSLPPASAGNPFTVEFFTSTGPDRGGRYEGKTSLGTFTITSDPFTVDVPGLTGYVTATATDSNGNTSVFSNELKAGVPPGEVKILGVAAKYAHVAAPGEDAWVTIKIENKTGETLKAAAGTALVKVYTGPDKQRLLATYTVPAGKTETLGKTPWTKKLKFQFPAVGDANEIAPGQYNYYVELDPVWKGKTGASVEPFDFVNQFGTVGDRKNVQVTIRGTSPIPGTAAASAGSVKFALKGAGTGTVTVVGGKTNLSFDGTTSDTRVTADDLGGLFQVHDIAVNDDLAFLDLGQVDADGTLWFDGSLGKLSLRSFGGAGSSLTLTASSDEPASLSLGSVHDTAITAFRPIDRLDVYEWVDNDGDPETLSAPSIGRLSVEPGSVGSGDFEVSMTLSGPAAADGLTLGKATVAGTLYSSEWTVGQAGSTLAVGSIQAARASDWILAATGRVGAVEVAGDWLNSMTADPALKAVTFGQITIGGDLYARGIEATGADVKSNVAIGGFKAKTVSHLDAFTADQGGIAKVEVAGWEAPTAFKTRWIKSLKTTIGDFTADLELTGTRPKTDDSLDSAKITGQLNGTWKVFADIGSVEAGEAPSWNLIGGQGAQSPDTLLGSLEVHNHNYPVAGQIVAGGFGKVVIDDILTGTLQATLPVPIASIQVGQMSGRILTLGDIGSLRSNTWVQSEPLVTPTLLARKVKHLLILGAASHGEFNLLGGAGTFIVGSMADCKVNAPGQTIGLFLVTGVDGATGPLFSRTDVTAGTLGVVQLKNVDEDPAAQAYGITADTVLAYSRSKDGKAVELNVDGKKTHVLHFPSPGVADQAGNYTLTLT